MASADDRLLTGKGFRPFKKMLMAKPAALADYRKMVGSAAFKHPIRYAEIDEFFSRQTCGCHLSWNGTHCSIYKSEKWKISDLRLQNDFLVKNSKDGGLLSYGFVVKRITIEPIRLLSKMR